MGVSLFDALYQVGPSRIERSVHPELVKLGFSRAGGSDVYEAVPLSFAQFRDLAAR